MEWIWIAFAVLGGWAMLALIGNERQRQFNESEARAKAAAKAEAKKRALGQTA